MICRQTFLHLDIVHKFIHDWMTKMSVGCNWVGFNTLDFERDFDLIADLRGASVMPNDNGSPYNSPPQREYNS